MSHDRRAEDAETAALLAALADGEALPPAERKRGGQLLAESTEAREAMVQHRALLGELRALPSRAPSPDWRALEASIQRACAEVPAPRKLWSWPRLRWPVFGLSIGLTGGVAIAGVALALWSRAPHEGAGPPDLAAAPAIGTDAAPGAAPGTPADAQPAVVASAMMPGDSAFLLDDELVSSDQLDERDMGELMGRLPVAAAITLGAVDAEPEDPDELLPRETFSDQIDQLDSAALQALDQWLDDPKQKG